ncbi:transglycosylase domain-containing protein [Actinoplanes derwentensis]|uniref:Membrane carboxypeptidase (Penicillin-binding protein) n=1 Tax=Actinoplanes derwentensis TaxID=113562 RepID=A0A1H2CYG5_9ACTN|nr:transglycosylase domain-containing protein [Actinoplanes derwentensis]GID82859.1 carboxypeptidase [Actinoplanes derwentensis]SDT75252.1 Membrane carboxypeptidase (penicillin-binding protein) [Actinoplanes derwentensis]
MTSWFRRRDHNIFTNATSLLVCGLLAGVVVAAAAFPAAAMTGLAAKAGGKTFANLPSELKEFSSPQITRAYASDGKTQIAVFYDEFRSDVPLKDISPHMQNAILAAEDRKFREHNGVDLKGVARAFVSNNQGGAQQGASTLTMQYVRMSLAYSATNPQEVIAATEDSPKRKINEMKYALQIEKQIGKDQILERYLNIAPFGNQAYGVFAASQVYFNKKPKDLTIGEASMLAGMVKAPSSFNPTVPSGLEQITDRRDNYIIPAMLSMGVITADQAEKAKKEKIPTKVKQIGRGCAWVARNHWGFFCDYFDRWWKSQEAFGATTYDRERRLKSGGYRIVTTLDIKGQSGARKQITDRQSDSSQNALLLAGIEPGTGKVRLLATNRKYKLDDPDNPKNEISSDPKKAAKKIRGTHPYTTNPLLTGGGDITGYQAGSVFKIFPIIAALEAGYPLAYPIAAQKQYKSGYRISPSSPAACGGGYYCPKNSGGGGEGLYTMWSAFAKSINTYFIPLQERVGTDKVVAVAKRFGVQFRQPKDAEMTTVEGGVKEWGAFSLGVTASTPLDMANAYATLAGDGKYCVPTPVEQITTQEGEKIDIGKPHCIQATTKDVARAALDAARCPVGDSAQLGSCNGATAGPTKGIVKHPVFGKSGTTDGSKTASLIVGTTKIVVAGYMANPDYPEHRDQMDHDVINPAVQYTVANYMEGKDRVQFKKPSSTKIAYGEQRSIPDVTCDSVSSATNRLEDAGFSVSRGSEIASDCPVGTVAGTNPSGRTIKNGVVVLEISSGKKDEEPGGPGPDNSTPPRRN